MEVELGSLMAGWFVFLSAELFRSSCFSDVVFSVSLLRTAVETAMN